MSGAFLTASPLALAVWLERRARREEGWFTMCAQTASLIPGKLGDLVRTAFYAMALDGFHTNAVVGFGSYFSKRGARVGQRVRIGAYCVVGLAEIEDDVRIASRVSIISGIHTHGRAADVVNEGWGAGQFQRVRIGSGTWIGEGATVGADVGRGALVAAGAVVLSAVPEAVTVMGNPARMVPPSRPGSARPSPR
jgi:virginiamycin A acetyltransferase